MDTTKNKEIAQYKEDGFEGFVSISFLRTHKSMIPKVGGVYIVIRDSEKAPEFLEKGTGGSFRDKNPNVPIEKLTEKYISDSATMYIGKATNLKDRIDQLLRFGAGKKVGHWGGRYLWQLADAEDLIVAWKPTPDCDPRQIENRMIEDFISIHGEKPFANLIK